MPKFKISRPKCRINFYFQVHSEHGPHALNSSKYPSSICVWTPYILYIKIYHTFAISVSNNLHTYLENLKIHIYKLGKSQKIQICTLGKSKIKFARMKCVVSLFIFCLACLQWDSTELVWSPVSGSTKLYLCSTVPC